MEVLQEMSKEGFMKISVEEFSKLQDWMLVSPKDSRIFQSSDKFRYPYPRASP